LDKKIITTDEKIARFVAVMVLGALDTIAGYKLSKQDFLMIKNAIKTDMKLDEAYSTFEEMITVMTEKN